MTTGKLDVADLQLAAAEACSLLKALANPDRLLLLCQISQGEYCVSELEDILNIKQPTLSQQLAVLREEGLVSAHREGKRMFYSIASKEATALIKLLHKQFCNRKAESH